jgi:hypothetical protein
MLTEIGSVDRVPGHIARVKAGELRLMGFGHRVYKNFDPRAKIIKSIAEQVIEVTGANPLLDIALALEKTALEDDYFVIHKLYPNVDFYSGIIYQAMGIPGRDVPGSVRDRPHRRLACPMGGRRPRPRAKDHPAAATLQRRTGTSPHRPARIDSRRVSRIPSNASV